MADEINILFKSADEILERLSRERNEPLSVVYLPARKLWVLMIPKGNRWMAASGTEDRTMFGCAFRAWQVWQNRKRGVAG